MPEPLECEGHHAGQDLEGGNLACQSRGSGARGPLRTVSLWACILWCAGGLIAPSSYGGPTPASSGLLGEERVYQVQIELRPEERARLLRDSRRYVPANLSIDGVNYGQVGLHLKGKGSFRNLDEKPSFTVNLAKFKRDQRFRGLRKIHLNNSVEDGSFLREWIGSELFRAAGVPAPEVGHAMVRLGDRQLGLYVVKEGFASEFLSRNFARSDGQLYELADGGSVPGGSSTEGTPFQRMIVAAQEPDLERRWQRLRETVDVDRFLSFMAMEVVACHWDGYSLARNNFRVYHDPGTDRMVFLPTGMDQLFANPMLTWRPHMAGTVARGFLEIPEGRELYRARVESIVAEDLRPERLGVQIERRVSLLSSALSASGAGDLREEAGKLIMQIAERREHLKSELMQPDPKLLVVPPEGALLTNWHPSDCPAQGIMDEDQSPDGRPSWHIVAGPTTSASWRSTVRLLAGQYRLRAWARVRDTKPLPFGKHHGARLRIAGMDRESACLLGTGGWECLQVSFAVPAPDSEVELICELRASGGECWFVRNPLLLRQTDDSLRRGNLENSSERAKPTVDGINSASNSGNVVEPQKHAE